ncbi:MAG: DUF92 domain-containing protein, partial [Vicinamibacterales bacterium]
MTAAAVSERARKILHVGMGGFALLLRVLPWWHAALLAGSALLFTGLALPRLGGTRLYREAEHTRGYSAGMRLYPLSILLLVLLFPTRLDIVAAAWGILAAGDGMAGLIGPVAGGPRIPWNREKSCAGSLAFWVCGSLAGMVLAWWCRPAAVAAPEIWFSLGAPILAAAIAALAETVPIRLDDNLTVPFTAAGVLWAASLVTADALSAWMPDLIQRLPIAVVVNAAVAVAGHRASTVSTSGAIVGAAIGSVIFLGTGWAGWALLMATFLAASVTSRIGLRRKTLLGIAEERGGRRGAGNALANAGIATIAAVLAAATPHPELPALALVAALTAGGSDTVASEVGKAFGRRTFLVHTGRPVPPGTPGAVSLEGTAAGLAGAFVLGSAGVGLGLVAASALAAIVVGATVGAFAESALGATLEH